METTFMQVVIIHYGNHSFPPYCRFFQRTSMDESMTCTKLSIAEAQKLLWELVLAGAEKTVCSNPFRSSISTVTATYFMHH